MRYYSAMTLILLVMGGFGIVAGAEAQEPAQPGDWIEYKIIKASEWIPAAVQRINLTLGPQTMIDASAAQWWQMEVEKDDGAVFVVQCLSERAPMTTESGDIGVVFRYIFQQHNCLPLEYTNDRTGLAYLPMFGFRDGLIPTPRSRMITAGPFIRTGNYLGQAVAAHAQGKGRKWQDPAPVKLLRLDDDVLIGTARMFKDDGSGQDEAGEYTYVELDSEDYDRMIEAGFNLFIVDRKHEQFVRDRAVFCVKSLFGKGDYPEMLYRSNYRGPAMFTDEPAIRLDTSDCRTPQDAANLLRLRNYSYHRESAAPKLDPRLTQPDAVIKMINEAGYSVGDWLPFQSHVPVWETVYESAFYQLQGGAAGIIHEGRYGLKEYNGYLQAALGGGAEVTVQEMYAMIFGMMRGAARCFGGDWGTSIYGQADYSIAPEAIRRAYDMGARYIWFWTSDHDHHLPFPKQLELARILRDWQKANPRQSPLPQLRKARVAVAIPDGYLCVHGMQWGNPRFTYYNLNEFGIPYGEPVSEAFWQIYRLVKQGYDVDCVVDVPTVIDNAGYDRIIRIGYDGRTNLPAPSMPALVPPISVSKTGTKERYEPRTGAPRSVARYVKPGRVSIDGDLKEWEGARWIELKEEFMYDVGHDARQGDADLSAQAAFAYDDEAIYIAARVTDDVMYGEECDALIWQNDSLQVSFDPLFNRHPEGAYALDDSEIGFSLVDGNPYVHRWTPTASGHPGEVPGAEVAIVRTGVLTVYEARVPFSSLHPLTPSFPGKCGVNIVVNDADSGLRRGSLAWTKGLADVKCPSCFGVLEFENADKLENPAPMAFAQGEKTVVRRGEDVLFRLDTGTRKPIKGELSATVWHRDLSAPVSTVQLHLPSGTRSHTIYLSSRDLESDSYKVEIAMSAGGRTALKQSFRIYVLPQ